MDHTRFVLRDAAFRSGVVSIGQSAAAQRRARRELDDLISVAMADLADARAGDLEAVFGAHRSLNRAVAILLRHRLDAA